MAIAKTASRNVAFKVARMRDAIIIMQNQDDFITRDASFEDVALVANDKKTKRLVRCEPPVKIQKAYLASLTARVAEPAAVSEAAPSSEAQLPQGHNQDSGKASRFTRQPPPKICSLHEDDVW